VYRLCSNHIRFEVGAEFLGGLATTFIPPLLFVVDGKRLMRTNLKGPYSETRPRPRPPWLAPVVLSLLAARLVSVPGRCFL
jgi:hypothetical protein